MVRKGLSRRALVGVLVASAVFPWRLGAQVRDQPTPGWSYPIGWPGRFPGDGFFIKHGYACENTAFYPGGWHTGENWYALEGDTAGADVIAVADGEIVYAGFDYPGPVVIVQHGENLYSIVWASGLCAGCGERPGNARAENRDDIESDRWPLTEPSAF